MPSIEVYKTELENPQLALRSANKLVESDGGRALITPELINKLPKESAVMLAVAISKSADAQSLLVENNQEITKALLAKDPSIATTIATTLMETVEGQKLLSANNKALLNTLMNAEHTGVRKATRALLHLGVPSENVSSIRDQENSAMMTAHLAS